MNKIKRGVIRALLALLCLPTLARAEPPGFYIGASGLGVDGDFRQDNDDDTGGEGRIGYRFNEFVAIEAAYLDLGEIVLPDFADAGGVVETDGYGLTALAIYPVGDFALLVRAGVLSWERDGVLGSIAGPRDHAEDGNDLLLGAGVSYRFSPRLEFRLDYNDSKDLRWVGGGINLHF